MIRSRALGSPATSNVSDGVSGLSGEIAPVKGPTTKPVILHKTLQLNYLIATSGCLSLR